MTSGNTRDDGGEGTPGERTNTTMTTKGRVRGSGRAKGLSPGCDTWGKDTARKGLKGGLVVRHPLKYGF